MYEPFDEPRRITRAAMTTQIDRVHGQAALGSPLRVLLVGPLPPPTGGATVSFGRLVDDLRQRQDCRIEVVNISRPRHRNTFWNNLYLAVRTLAAVSVKARDFDVVSFHANERGRSQFGPLIFILTRLLRRPLVMRAFGGAFDRTYLSFGWFRRCLLRTTFFKSEACLFETRRQTRFFSRYLKSRSVWYPNCTRPPIPDAAVRMRDRRSCEKLVFLSRVERAKGVETLLEAAPLFPSGVTVDLYGTLEDGYTRSELEGRGAGRLFYRGVLERERVQETLWRYDALVLPTCARTEGYPAVVLEAFTHGMPVVVSGLPTIREIVDDSVGILIALGDPADLAAAVARLISVTSS